MRTDPTVLVLGGGPAAMATAITLARSGVSVVAAMRSCSDLPRTGDILCPGAKPLLQTLGAWESICEDQHLPSSGVVSSWEEDELQYSDFYFDPYGCGWSLDRQRFDFRLSLVAESSGVQVHRQMRSVDLVTGYPRSRVEMQSAKQSILLYPRFVVDATGRSAWLARRCGARRIACDRLIAIVGIIHRRQLDRMNRRLLLEAVEHGWWYSTDIPRNAIIAGFMTDADYLAGSHEDPRTFWFRRLREAHYTHERLSGDNTVGQVRVTSAQSYCMSLVGGVGWAAVGDAAMAWDPLTAQGIMKALDDGLNCAAAIVAALNADPTALERRRDFIQQSFVAYCHTRDHFYGRVRRWPSSLFWRRRQSPN